MITKMTEPADPHSRLVAEVQRRLEVARKACCGTSGAWHLRIASDGFETERIEDENEDVVVYDEGSPGPYEAEHIALHDPADAIRRYEADLRRLERHQPGVNGRYCDDEACSTATRDGLIINWPCDEVRDLAASLGVEVTDGAR